MKILFVCLGNICRSPAAEGVMKKIVEEAGFSNEIICASAGTAGYHSGEAPDHRMIKHALRRNISLTSRARQFKPAKDFDEFDLILAMDKSNFQNIQAVHPQPANLRDQVFLITDFCKRLDVSEVPDPYYKGPEDFELVLDILEDACSGLLQKITSER